MLPKKQNSGCCKKKEREEKQRRQNEGRQLLTAFFPKVSETNSGAAAAAGAAVVSPGGSSEDEAETMDEQRRGTQISCFAPNNFSLRQAAYVDSFCWAAVQQQARSPIWLHKFFPYILLSLAILLYIPAMFWRLTAAPQISSDLHFIMEELDRFYNRSIRLAKNLMSSDNRDACEGSQSALDLAEGCFKYPLVEQYLKTKRSSHSLVVKYLFCRGLTLLILLLACIYLGYYIRLASLTDEFSCDLRTGVLRNSSAIPSEVQCKLVAVGVFRLLSYINLVVYVLLAPLVVYAAVRPARQSSSFLRPYELLPGFGTLGVVMPIYNDLSIYLLFLQENLSELKSFKCLQVLELLQEADDEGFDTMCLLQTLGQVKTDVLDSKKTCPFKINKEETKSEA